MLLFVCINKPISTLTDLTVPTPFVIVETFENLGSDCSTSPSTLTEWRTIIRSGSEYGADGVPYTVSTNMQVTYTFHDLFLTVLHPGEVLTGVCLILLSLPYKY